MLLISPYFQVMSHTIHFLKLLSDDKTNSEVREK